MNRLSKLFKPLNPGLHDAPNYDSIEKMRDASRVFCIRHARSHCNEASSALYDKSPPEGLPVADWVGVMADRELQDANLSEPGIK